MVIKGTELKKIILEDIKEKLKSIDRQLGLAVVQVGNDEASNVYIGQKEKLTKELNYKFIHKKFNEDISQEKLIQEIELLNDDDTIDGILIQMPLPSHLNSNIVLNSVDPDKDVDGLTYINAGRLVQNEPGLVPCTPKGVIDLLDYNKITITGKNIAVIGRSVLVGKPVTNMLINRNATVTLCHSKTSDIKSITKNSDIIVVGVGKKHYLTKDMIKEGATVVDVGINRVDGKLYGDADFENLKDKCSFITPVPGGIGPMTIAELGANVYNAYTLKKKRN